MKKRQWVRYALVGGVGLLTIVALALSASNGYVTVSCDTAGVEDIVAIDVDFYITTRGVSAPDFVAGVGVSADLPWKLVEPASGSLELGIANPVPIESKMKRVRRMRREATSAYSSWTLSRRKRTSAGSRPA